MMRTRFLRALLIVLAMSPSMAFAQAAGRVLLAIGEVSVERAGQTQPLAFNAPVFTGDTLRLGANSNAQIRMSDESIVGLRERSVFRIDEYQFSGGTGRSLYSLLAGGMRTVTGALGRLKQDQAYAVRTPTSTIGIRGTHYTIVFCNNDCGATQQTASLQLASAGDISNLGPLAQSSPGGGAGVANGTYGGVSDGRINVAPLNAQQLGREFGNDEYFFQANANSAPQSLVAPPSFLYDRLSGQQRSQGQRGQESGETLSQGGINAESRPSNVPAAPTPPAFVVTEQKNSSGESTVAAASADTAFLGGWITPGSNNDNVAGGVLLRQSALTLGSDGHLQAFTIPAGCKGPVGDDCDAGASGNLNSPLESSYATFPHSTQKVFWGRWNSGSINDGGTPVTLSSTTQSHFLHAPLTPQETMASKTGTLALQSTFPGGYGTSPTNNFGSTPTSGSMPTITINFTSQSVSVGSSFLNFPSAGSGTQNWSFSSGTGTLVLANGGAYFLVNATGSCSSGGTACNGTSSFTANRQAAGIFIGPAGDHAGVALSGAAGSSQFSTVRVYCPSC